MVGARWKIYAAYLAVALAYLGVRALALESGGPGGLATHLNNPMIELPLVWRIVNALQVTFRYLWLLLFPLHLSSDYSFNQIPLITSFASPCAYAVVALAAGSLWGVILLRRISKPAFFAVGFALTTFSIVSNLVVSIGTIMAERLLYVPSIGFCLAAALALRGLCERFFANARLARGAFLGIVTVVVILNGYRAHLRGADWFSAETLPLADLETSPKSAKIHYNVAVVLFNRERRELDAALGHVRRALEIEPEYPRALLLLGHVLITQGKRADAIEAYERELDQARRMDGTIVGRGAVAASAEGSVRPRCRAARSDLAQGWGKLGDQCAFPAIALRTPRPGPSSGTQGDALLSDMPPMRNCPPNYLKKQEKLGVPWRFGAEPGDFLAALDESNRSTALLRCEAPGAEAGRACRIALRAVLDRVRRAASFRSDATAGN